MITNFDKYASVSLWCLVSENGDVWYFKTEKSAKTFVKKHHIKVASLSIELSN